jgi:putative transcriptional regulator
MSRRIADGILCGLRQALAHAEGTAEEGTYVVHIPPEIDIKAIRGRLGMTQQEFATCFDFNINTLRHWEQGRRVPDGTARAYLKVIDREPEAVQKALRTA